MPTKRLQHEIEHGKTDIAKMQPEYGWSGPAGKIRRARRIAFMLKGLHGDAKVLEVGAGTGLQTADLSKKLNFLTAIDISPDLLAVAKTRAPGATYRVMDAHKPEFPENSFDAILGVSLLHHLDWDTALKNYFPLLKPGGIVRFSDPNLVNPQIYLQKNVPFLRG